MKRRNFLGKAAGLVATMTALSGMGRPARRRGYRRESGKRPNDSKFQVEAAAQRTHPGSSHYFGRRNGNRLHWPLGSISRHDDRRSNAIPALHGFGKNRHDRRQRRAEVGSRLHIHERTRMQNHRHPRPARLRSVAGMVTKSIAYG